MPASVPHLALPLRVGGDGRFAVLEQDSGDEIAQNVAVILATPEGSRAELPEFGAPRFDFEIPDPSDVIEAVKEWEPRADLSVSVVAGLGTSQSLARIRAEVRPHVGGDDQ